MSLFLSVVPVEEAAAVLDRIAPPPRTETVSLARAAGRILARDVTADVDVPGFSRSTVDGFAVAAPDTAGAGEAIPAMLTLTGRVEMGTVPEMDVSPGTTAAMPTGGVLPDGADAVVMLEYCEVLGDQVLVHRPVASGENVIRRGDDFRAGELVCAAGRTLRPQECGVLAAAGVAEVPVTARPRIAVISTGNELVPPDRVPGPGQIRDANTALVASYIAARGGSPEIAGIVADDPEILREAVRQAARDCDAVFISGGSSKDERDATARVIGELGEVLVHGIAISPGKPTIIGTVGPTPVMGLPGHPASAFVVLVVLGGHLLSLMQGAAVAQEPIRARLTRNIPSARGREDYVRVRLRDGAAEPCFGPSGLINTLAESDGLVRIPAGREGLETGDEVEVIRW
ncbi:MAG: gephyrin-like molybdotransferase Glp [Methanomicrobiales archaeon]